MGEIVQQVKAIVVKSEDLSSAPRTLVVEGEDQLQRLVL